MEQQPGHHSIMQFIPPATRMVDHSTQEIHQYNQLLGECVQWRRVNDAIRPLPPTRSELAEWKQEHDRLSWQLWKFAPEWLQTITPKLAIQHIWNILPYLMTADVQYSPEAAHMIQFWYATGNSGQERLENLKQARYQMSLCHIVIALGAFGELALWESDAGPARWLDRFDLCQLVYEHTRELKLLSPHPFKLVDMAQSDAKSFLDALDDRIKEQIVTTELGYHDIAQLYIALCQAMPPLTHPVRDSEQRRLLKADRYEEAGLYYLIKTSIIERAAREANCYDLARAARSNIEKFVGKQKAIDEARVSGIAQQIFAQLPDDYPSCSFWPGRDHGDSEAHAV